MARAGKSKIGAGAKRSTAGRQSSKSPRKGRAPTRASKKSPRSSTSVMGMRVPNTLRNALDSLVNSERGREILASALVAAASAAAAALVKKSDSPQPAKARLAAAEVGEQRPPRTSVKWPQAPWRN
jgi:hypothetical protein